MSTTTLRLPDDVKARIERLAAAQGISAHALMVDALAESTAAMERRIGFEAEAAQRWADYRRTGEHFAMEDVRAYVLARARGEDPPKPLPRKDATLARTKQRR